MRPILVTGAGGQVGGVGHKVVTNLLEQKLPVRAMLRTQDERAEKLRELGAVSQMSIAETTPSPQHKLHWLGEQVLNWSGLPVVHVRPTVFLENFFFLKWARESITTPGELRLPFGEACTSPIATADVARVITEILRAPQPHIGNVYELTGAQCVGLAEIAKEYAAALGRPVRYVDVDWDEWKDHFLPQQHLPPHVAAHIGTMALLHRQNRYDRFTTDVQKITGTAPTTISDWVRNQPALFGRVTEGDSP